MIRICSYLMNRRGVIAAGLVLAAMAAAPTPIWGQWDGTNPVWTNSNVGIGTQYPAARFTISSAAGGSLNSGIYLQDTGGRSFSIASRYNLLGFADESAAQYRLVINSSGNTGIG